MGTFLRRGKARHEWWPNWQKQETGNILNDRILLKECDLRYGLGASWVGLHSNINHHPNFSLFGMEGLMYIASAVPVCRIMGICALCSCSQCNNWIAS